MIRVAPSRQDKIMSTKRLDPDHEAETQDTFLLPPTVSDTENDVLNFNNLTTSPLITVAPWLGINSTSKLWLHCECTYADGTLGYIELAEAVPMDNSTSTSAFSCDLPLDELSKLGDNTLITLILMVSTDGTRASRSLASVRHSLMFQHPIVLTDYSRWMTNIGPDLELLRISDLLIPQTHNAGVDQKGAGWPTDQWGACQDDSFSYQLRQGARAFDLRLYRDPEKMYTHKEFIFKHGRYHSRRYLNDCIHGALAFAERNPGEIIILDFNVTELDDRVESVLSTLEIVLGKRCIPRSAASYTIGHIRQRHPGRNIIVTSKHDAWFCWGRSYHSWTGLDFNDTSDLVPHISTELGQSRATGFHSTFACGYNDLGPIRYKSHAAHWHTYFNAIKSDAYRHPTIGNLIRVDFIAGTGVVDRCITATRERATQARASVVMNLSASNITTHSIQLTWNAPLGSGTILDYQIFEDNQRIATTVNTHYLVSGLHDGTTYNFSVSARYSAGHGALALLTRTTIGVPDTTAPSQPTELRFTYFDNSNFAFLGWNAAYDNVAVTGYEIYQDDTLLGTIDSKHTVYPLTVNSTSMYKVRALDAAGNFADSEPIVGHPDTTPPSKPTKLEAIEIKADSIVLEWVASTDNVAVIGYDIYRDNALIDRTDSCIFLDRGLDEGTHYYYKVRALDYSGNFADSDSLAVRTSGEDTTPPSAPTQFETLYIGDSSVILKWNPPSENPEISHYEILRDNKIIHSGLFNHYTDNELHFNTQYVYQVRAVDTAGNIGLPASLTVRTLSDTTPPTAPTHLRATAVAADIVTLEWSEASDNHGVLHYVILRDGQVLNTTPHTRYVDLGLGTETLYIYQVRAVDRSGNVGPVSASLAVRTLARDTTPPSAPTNLRPALVTDTNISLEWSAATDNVGVSHYEVLRDNIIIATIVTPYYSDTGLKFDTQYIYQVRAVDTSGNIGLPASITIRTNTPDTTPPSQVTNLKASVISDNSITLEWTAATDNIGVRHYEIERDNNFIKTTTATHYTDAGLKVGQEYVYRVRAADDAGNIGLPVSITVRTQNDTTRPSAPKDLRGAFTTADSVTLTWSASSDNVGVKHYEVLRNFLHLGDTTSTQYIDRGVTPASYFYQVRAVDAAGNSATSESIMVSPGNN